MEQTKTTPAAGDTIEWRTWSGPTRATIAWIRPDGTCGITSSDGHTAFFERIPAGAVVVQATLKPVVGQVVKNVQYPNLSARVIAVDRWSFTVQYENGNTFDYEVGQPNSAHIVALADDELVKLPVLPAQSFFLAGPHYADGSFYKAPTTWKRCCACSHHAYIPVDSSVCGTCDEY